MAMRTIAPFLAYEADAGGTGVPLLAKGTPGQILVAAADTTQTSIVATAYRLTDGAEFVPAANNHGAVEGFRVDIPDDAPGVWFVSGPVASYQPTVEGSRGERGLPGVNGVETDEAIGEYMSTPGTNTNAETRVLIGKALDTGLDARTAGLLGQGTQTREQLDAILTPEKPTLWDDFAGGVTLHRGGGAPLPQSTIDGLRGAVAAGCTHLDIDMRLTADGVAVMAHDNAMGPYTNIPNGTWKDQQSALLGSVRWEASRTVGGRWPDVPVSTIANVLDEFGGKIPIAIEPKNQIGIGEWADSINRLGRLIKDRGLERSVVVGLYTEYLATHAPVVKNAGLMLLVHFSSATPGFDDPAQIAAHEAAGVDCVILSSLTSNSTISAWLRSSVPIVMVSPGGRRWRWAELKALGVNSCVDDYAVYAGGLNATVKTDPYRNGQWGTGDIPADGHVKPALLTNGLRFDKPTSSYQAMLMGDFAPLPASFTMDFEVELEGLDVAAPWFGFNICAQDDKSWKNAETNPTGYLCFIAPRTGNLSIWQRVNGSSLKRAETVAGGPVIAPNGTLYGRIEVTPTTVSISQVVGGVPQGKTTFTDSQYRGGYLHAAAFFSSDTSAAFTVKKITIT